MKMKKYLIPIILCLFGGIIQTYAQQLPLFSQYREFHSFLNPAILHCDYVSMTYRPNHVAGISYRNQWTGLSNSPKTMVARYENVSEKYNSIFGGNLINDQLGPVSRTGFYGRYTYRVTLNRYAYMTFGALFGGFQFSYKPTNEIILQDDIIAENPQSRFSPDFSLGAFYNQELANDDVLYVGLSFPQVAVESLEGDGSSTISKATHTYLNVGLYKYLGDGFGNVEGAFFLEPSVWIKYANGAPLHTDFNLRLQLPPLFWIGIGYGVGFLDRPTGTFFHAEAGILFDESFGLEDQNIKIGFGYDNLLTPSSYAGFGTTYEVNLTYSWLTEKRGRRW